ncbi:MAG TPA: 3-dehydroquinate synthase [Lacunisphaera sp.]|nr:3-dehydroquinate synthase [Lacunisphaera sp.]
MSLELLVNVTGASYPIRFAGDPRRIAVELLGELTKAGRPCVVVSDDGVARSQGKFLQEVLGSSPQLILPAGERTKSLAVYGQTLDFLAANQVNRQGVLWAVGGGVVGDLAGFAAASYLRGIDCIQVPTTLLAMVDSSVGGKTGINLAAGKNLVGAFHHPRTVIIATEFLDTLPGREFAAGMAEVIKYGLLGDAALFGRLERDALTVKSSDLAAVIRRCCEMKAEIVRADERETATEDGRALLNLGHTFGHAIEQVTGFRDYLHGEAVAVGLAAAARLSARLGLFQPTDTARVERVLTAHQLPARLRSPLPTEALMNAMQHDKKVRSGRLRFVVLNAVGRAATRADIDPTLVGQIWREVGAA